MRKLLLPLLLCMAFPLFAQNRLSWLSGGSGVAFYEIEIEEQDDAGTFYPLQTERTQGTELDVHLPIGRYRYRIISFNALGRAAAASDWYQFRVYPRITPEVSSWPRPIEVLLGHDYFSFDLSGKNLIEGAEIYLAKKDKAGKAGGPVLAFSTSYSRDETGITAIFETPLFDPGNYDITVINPGGLSQTIENVPLKAVRQRSVSSGGSRFTFGAGGEGNGGSLDRASAALVLYGGFNLTDDFTAGLKATAGWDFTEFAYAEGGAFFRWYALRFPERDPRFNLFLQAGAGAGYYVYKGENLFLRGDDTQTKISFMGEGIAGLRILLGERFFVEPYARAAYPEIWGAGIIIGW